MAMVGITSAQVRAINALAGKASMDRDELHSVMDGLCGKVSTKALTINEAARVIDRLRTLTGEKPFTPSAPPVTNRERTLPLVLIALRANSSRMALM